MDISWRLHCYSWDHWGTYPAMGDRATTSWIYLLVSNSYWGVDNSYCFNWPGGNHCFFVPILILQHPSNHPKLEIPKPPSWPIALVVTLLIELGNAHVSNLFWEKDAIDHYFCDCRKPAGSFKRGEKPDVDSIIRNETFQKKTSYAWELMKPMSWSLGVRMNLRVQGLNWTTSPQVQDPDIKVVTYKYERTSRGEKQTKAAIHQSRHPSSPTTNR